MVKNMKIMKNKQRAIKKFLTRKLKMGDSSALLLRVALEIESRCDNAKKYPNYKIIGNKMEDACKAYLNHLKNHGLNYGLIYTGEKPLPFTIIGELPNGSTIAYRCSEDYKWRDVPLYVGEWDQDSDNNREKIERNITELYGDEIYDCLTNDDALF